jgi:hypothetical protein
MLSMPLLVDEFRTETFGGEFATINPVGQVRVTWEAGSARSPSGVRKENGKVGVCRI